MIDDKEHYYDFAIKRWQLTKKERDKIAAGTDPKAGATALVTTTTPVYPSSTVGNIVGAAPQANSLEARELAVANAARQIEMSLRGLVSQFN
jgi:hypothetical protein